MRKVCGVSLLLLASWAQAQQVQVLGIGGHQGPSLLESPMLQNIIQNRDHIVTFTDSAQAEISDNTNKITLTGDAQVRRTDAILKGDRIIYDRTTGEVEALGNARLLRDGTLVTGPGLKYNVDKKTGVIESPVFRMSDGGAGHADRAEMVDDNHVRLTNALYSACNCGEAQDRFWYVKSPNVDIYNDENEGIAEDGTLYIAGVPVFWSPYFTFPVRREKKTGVLVPTVGYTSRSGYDLMVPYFINLAPNYDMTLFPRYVSKRGPMLGAEFRYLQPSYSGQFSMDYMARDSQLGHKRWTYSWVHRQQLGEVAGLNFGLNINLNRASDSDYFRDFTKIAINEADRTYLPQSVSLTFSGYDYWSGYLRMLKYQSLHDFSGETPRYYYQYNRMPEFMVRGQRFDWNGFDVSTQNTITKFEFPLHEGKHRRWNGTRMVSYNQLSYPIVRPGWYVTPKVGLHLSQYNTDWYSYKSQAGTQDKSISRVVPIFSVDAGMTFERETTLFGKPRIQTLEPRLYYLRIPHKNQAGIPLYDTSISQFNFGTAFSENRYVGGWDRINNANLLALGVTSRWLDEETGNERMAVQLAQRFYFDEQKVSLSNAERLREKSKSEFLANLSVGLTDTLNTETGIQFDTYEKKIAQTYASIRWFPKRLTSLSLTYRYQRDPFYQYDGDGNVRVNAKGEPVPIAYQLPGKENLSIAGQWPLTDQLYAVGRYDYSLREKRSTQSILGLEYKGDCCWTGRLVMQRYAVTREKSNSAIFLQVELTGLGAVGSDPMELLRDSIPGYQQVKNPEPAFSPFERYE